MDVCASQVRVAYLMEDVHEQEKWEVSLFLQIQRDMMRIWVNCKFRRSPCDVTTFNSGYDCGWQSDMKIFCFLYSHMWCWTNTNWIVDRNIEKYTPKLSQYCRKSFTQGHHAKYSTCLSCLWEQFWVQFPFPRILQHMEKPWTELETFPLMGNLFLHLRSDHLRSAKILNVRFQADK